MLGFNITENGVILDDEATLRQAREQEWKAAYASLGELNTAPATPNGQLITNEAAQINNVNQTMLWILQQMSPKTATGLGLDYLCSIIGITRKLAIPTQITVRCFGAVGTTIYGKLNATPSKIQDSASNVFVSENDYVIGPDGFVDALFTAVDGFVNSVGVFTILTIQTGWESITTPYPIIEGTPTESDNALRARYESAVTQNGVGTVASMAGYINNSVPDVIYATGDENNTGTAKIPYAYEIAPHSYVISVLGGDNAAIAQAIYDKMSMANQQGNTTVGVYDPINGQTYPIKFLRPDELALDIQVTITDSPYVPSDIVTQIESICNAVFDAKPERMFTKYYGTMFQTQIAQISGVNNVTVQLSIDGGSTWLDSVQYDLDKYSVMGEITVDLGSES